MTNRLRFFTHRALLITGGILIIFAALLWLDLSTHGLAWRVFWSLTGEEEPFAQVRGMVEWAGKFTRQQPRLAPLTPMAHTEISPFGVNTFLEQEVEVAKRERQLQMIADAGFVWIRQQFPWADIEIHGRGDFADRRNDLDGDGQPDVVDAWAKYDNIVDLAEQYGLQIQARLDNPPEWTHADPAVGAFAPPDDVQDFVNYAAAVAARYKGRIRYYQVWNEPNIYPEWGELPVNPELYTELLCRTYRALKRIDPEIVVISGAMAPTIALTGRDLNDFIYLQRMYGAGAGRCFDVMSVQGYGLNSGPTDTRMRPTTVNFSRNLYIRDIMVANGDAHKPIWISEAAWIPVDDPDVPDDVVGKYNYGRSTRAQAARYMPLAYERIQRDMPWIGVMNYWFFKRASDYEKGQAFYYFRMVEPDFTPLPVYDSMKAYIQTYIPTLYFGIHQAEHYAITLDSNAETVEADGAQLRTAARVTAASFNFDGTYVRLRWQGDKTPRIVRDGTFDLTVPETTPDEFGWRETRLFASLTAVQHTLNIESETPFLLDSVLVLDMTLENLLPLVMSLLAVLLVAIAVLVAAFRARGQK